MKTRKVLLATTMWPTTHFTISLKSIRPNKTEIKIIAEKVFDKCLQEGSNLQLAPPYDHCSNALGYNYTVRFIAPILLYHCENLKAIRYESTSFNRIAADKSHRVIVA